MFNLFKPAVQVIEKAITKDKTTNEIVQEIHESFYTEVDNLLASARILKSTESQLDDLILKADKLKSLGFINTKECKEAQLEINRLKIIKEENSTKENLVSAINYFSQKYPFNKFITEESVIKICNKYNLVYGPIERYEGTVPDKNLNEIANCKISEEDSAYVKESTVFNFSMGDDRTTNYFINKSTFEYYNTEEQLQKQFEDRYRSYSMHSRREVTYKKCPLEIAAPVKDFNMKGYEVKGVKISKIHIPDPVVLHPVIYNNVKYYLIVSAWGEEASDELVVNNKFN